MHAIARATPSLPSRCPFAMAVPESAPCRQPGTAPPENGVERSRREAHMRLKIACLERQSEPADMEAGVALLPPRHLPTYKDLATGRVSHISRLALSKTPFSDGKATAAAEMHILEGGAGSQRALDYDAAVEGLRGREYPMLQGKLYLDHAGTTLIPKSLTERFAADLVANLYGNPHSASPCSQASRRRIDDVRVRLLTLFGADPLLFDVVFVANATAGVKLVRDAFHGLKHGFCYGYHGDCHTSLIGVREGARHAEMLASDDDVERWIAGGCGEEGTRLLAYPAQSHMNGRRLPLEWCRRIRERGEVYTLLDAAAYVSTSPLDLSDESAAPDFTVMSLYKIFGFPDLGALIVRKEAGKVFEHRGYFGGGTVDMVLAGKEEWHVRKTDALHEQLEDGTLPIHSIIALDHALDVFAELFGSLERASKHTAFLAARLFNGLAGLQHANGVPVCEIYKQESSSYANMKTQGPVVAFNIRNKHRAWISMSEVERLAAVKDVQLRTGGLCAPAAIASTLSLEPWEMRRNFSAGHRCGSEFGPDITNGKPTGMIRVSLGAMSTLTDVSRFVGFVEEFFLDMSLDAPRSPSPASVSSLCTTSTGGSAQPPNNLRVESIVIYPIKSCRGWKVRGRWAIRKSGLAWDREWCLVHEGTLRALSLKHFPRMALIQPEIDLERGVLAVRCEGVEISVPLSDDPRYFRGLRTARVMGEKVGVRIYQSLEISDFFSGIVGSRCQLARFPSSQIPAPRDDRVVPGAWVDGAGDAPSLSTIRMSLANDSPLLVVSRASLTRLNEDIRAGGGTHVAEIGVFRANIVLAGDDGMEPYVEDGWKTMRIGHVYFGLAGRCRRCQMVCNDPMTGERRQEPYATLAKKRRIGGQVVFGQHAFHMDEPGAQSWEAQNPTIAAGDAVEPFLEAL